MAYLPFNPKDDIKEVAYDVQEFICTNRTTVPHIFLRDKLEKPSQLPNNFETTGTNSSIPIIDLARIMNGDQEEFHREIKKITDSCENWGFFQVINHGIDSSLIDNIEKVTADFFMLPLEEKQMYQIAPGSIQGYGQIYISSSDKKLDWVNMLGLVVEPHHLREQRLWPTKPTNFRDYLEEYSREVSKLSRKLLQYIAISLGLKRGVFEEIFGLPVHSIRMNYYPPCPRPNHVVGLSPHCDASGLTILHQAKGSPIGLHVLKENQWIPVQPIPNALVVNLGETMQVLTNGRYKSVEHRAVVDKEKHRLSIASFYSPSYEAELGPLEECVNEKNLCKYKRYNHGEYSRKYVATKFEGKGDQLKLTPNFKI